MGDSVSTLVTKRSRRGSCPLSACTTGVTSRSAIVSGLSCMPLRASRGYSGGKSRLARCCASAPIAARWVESGRNLVTDARFHPRVAVVEVAHGVAGWVELVEPCALVAQRKLQYRERLPQLLHGARAEDGRRDARLVLAPQQRHLAGRETTLARDPRHGARHRDRAPRHALRKRTVAPGALEAGARRDGLKAVVVAAGQDAAGQRRPWQQAQPV